MSKVTKSTTLEGYYATGDDEAFCFDIHAGPREHRSATRSVPDRDDCRSYPNDLIPDGTYGKRGRWTITVEFEPYDDPSN